MTTLSACLIVRDEDQHLEECLTALRAGVDEICVLDTGSEDRTLEIAERLADRVACFRWCSDFSAARNASLTMASGDWILVVDADELLEKRGVAALRKAVESEDAKAKLVSVDSVPESGRGNSAWIPRLFRNDPAIRFENTVCESVLGSLVELGVTSLDSIDVHLTHIGHVGEAASRKRMRNLMLMRARALQAPDDLYNNYQLAANLSDSDQAIEQLSAFEVAHRQAEEVRDGELTRYPFLPLVYDGFAEALVRQGRLDQAQRVVSRGLERFAACTELHYRSGDVALRRGDIEKAEVEFNLCLEGPPARTLYPVDPRVFGVRPALGLSRVHIERGEFDAAAKAVTLAMDCDAGNMAARCLAIRLLLTGEDAEQGMRGLDDLMCEQPEATRVRLLAGEVALASGDRGTAIDLWRAASMQGHDAAHEARCRLAIAELGDEGGLDKARDHLARLRDRDVDSAACRVILSVATGTPLSLDASLDSDDVLHKLVPPLRQLLEAPQQDAVQAFAANAGLYREALPGVDSILVPEG